jgi:hypothetical protein
MEQFLSMMETEEDSTVNGIETEKEDSNPKEKSERKGYLTISHNNTIAEAHFFHAVLALHKGKFEKGNKS